MEPQQPGVGSTPRETPAAGAAYGTPTLPIRPRSPCVPTHATRRSGGVGPPRSPPFWRGGPRRPRPRRSGWPSPSSWARWRWQPPGSRRGPQLGWTRFGRCGPS